MDVPVRHALTVDMQSVAKHFFFLFKSFINWFFVVFFMLVVTSQNFEKEVVHSSKKVIVDFWASWCEPCRTVAPTFEALSKEMPDVVFAKLNVDEQGELAHQFNVQSIPTFLIFKKGKEVGRILGAVDKARLQQAISSA